MIASAIVESGMTFGPYPEGSYFYIEKSAAYRAIKESVKMAEFLLLKTRKAKPHQVWIIEAKSSSPRVEAQPNFDEFIAEIRDKLINAFSLGLALRLGRHKNASADLPARFKNLNCALLDFRFVLVINGHHDDWLPPLHDALTKELYATVKTWGLSPCAVVVMNDSLAREHGLISTDGGTVTL
jgi:hypothetical protein